MVEALSVARALYLNYPCRDGKCLTVKQDFHTINYWLSSPISFVYKFVYSSEVLVYWKYYISMISCCWSIGNKKNMVYILLGIGIIITSNHAMHDWNEKLIQIQSIFYAMKRGWKIIVIMDLKQIQNLLSPLYLLTLVFRIQVYTCTHFPFMDMKDPFNNNISIVTEGYCFRANSFS